MAKRDYPNNYFAWYNDDDKLAILYVDSASDSSEKTKEMYDTYSDSTIANGLRIHYHAQYGEAKDIEDDLKKDLGLAVGLQPYLVDYIKSRILEDAGDLERASFFRKRYTMEMQRYPSRISGVRTLSVPKL
jgi:hypothetical protein